MRQRRLSRRRAIDYWRLVLPRALAGGRPLEIKRSLRTYIYSEAVRRARRLDRAAEQALEQLQDRMTETSLSTAEMRRLIRRFVDQELEALEDLRAEAGHHAPGAAAAASAAWQAMAEMWRDQLLTNDLEPASQLVYSFLTGEGVRLDPEGPAFKRFVHGHALRHRTCVDLR